MVSRFRDESYDPFVYVCGGFSLVEQCPERLEEVQCYLLLTFVEELHGYVVVARRFALRKGSNGSSDLL